MSSEEIKVVVKAETSSLAAGMKQAAGVVKDAVSQITTSLGSIAKSLNLGQLAAAASAAMALAMREGVAATVELHKSSELLGRQLGVTATEASVLKVAMGDAQVTQGQMDTAIRGVTNALQTNEGKFRALGVATRDANGNLRPTLDIMADANAKLMQFREGTDRNVEAAKLYGRGWQQVLPTLGLTAERMAEAKAKADELGLAVGVQSTAAANAYRDAMNDVGDVIDGVKITIGNALLPVLADLATWFSDHGPTAIDFARKGIVGIIIAFEGLVTTGKIIGGILGAVWDWFTELGGLFIDVTNALGKFVKFDFEGGAASWQKGVDRMKKPWSTFWAQATADAEEFSIRAGDAIDRAMAKQTPLAPKKPGGGGNPDAQAGEAELRGWDSFFNGMTKRTAQSRLALSKLLLDQQRDELQQRRALETEAAEQQRRLDLEALEGKRQKLRLGLELMLTTRADELKGLREIENEKYQVELQALQRKLELQQYTVVERREILNQIELLEREHQNNLQKIDDDAMIDRKRHWLGFFRGIDSGFKSVIQGFLQGTRSLAGLVKGLFDTVLASIAGVLADIAAKWLAQQLLQRIIGKTTAASVITGEVAKAGAGGVASMAAAPFPLNLSAPAFGAAMAAAAALYAPVAAAARGFDIPAGVNPIVQTHAREMILPPEQADVIRGMAGGGQARPLHVTINAVDARGIEKLLRNNSSGLSKMVERGARIRRPGLMPT